MKAVVSLLLLVGCSGDTAFHMPAPGARCSDSSDAISCRHQTVTLSYERLLTRDVHFMTPDGPLEPRPVAILFQGSFHSADSMWSAHKDDAFGGWYQTQLVRALLESGFTVVTPEARGSTYWDTNIPPYSDEWNLSEDDKMMQALLAALDHGTFGPVTEKFAAGISSGGFMTSRMAVSYRGKFQRLAIESASYATCSAVCDVPDLPPDHPPTLFLHGEADDIVPVSTMRPYAQKLGDKAKVITEPNVGHQWLDVAPREIPAFFAAQ